MPGISRKKTGAKAVAAVWASLPPYRTGLPAKDSITGVTAGPGKYTIIHTQEMDAYDKATLTPPTGDDFQGTARKAAKLSICNAKTETFSDLKDLIHSLVADARMIARKPPITTTATSNRVKEENRNVRVIAFVYAASREADNDFHLIVGRDPKISPDIYMTMELSGLPPAGAPSFARLKAARDTFRSFFSTPVGEMLPGPTYDFYHPPIAAEIEGSLFFDMSHATGPHPGPPSLKSRMPVLWEVHPVSRIIFS